MILHLPVPRVLFFFFIDSESIEIYTFNTGTARHLFCRYCGMHPFYHPRTDPENYSVNARCLDDFDPVVMAPRRVFDGRRWEEAFARSHDEWAAR